MGYRIQYGVVTTREILREKKKRDKYFVIVASTIAVIMSLCYLRNKSLLPLIYPGDTSVTKNAVENLIDGIEEGVPVAQAFGDFCFEILRQK